MSLRLTKQQLDDIISEVQFQQKRIRKAIALFGEKPGWVLSYKRMKLLLKVLSAISRGKRIEVVDEDEVMDDVGVHCRSATQQ